MSDFVEGPFRRVDVMLVILRGIACIRFCRGSLMGWIIAFGFANCKINISNSYTSKLTPFAVCSRTKQEYRFSIHRTELSMLHASATALPNDGFFMEQIAYETFARLPRSGPALLRTRLQPTFGKIRNPLMKNMAPTFRASTRRPASTTVQELKARLASFGDRRGSAPAPLSFGIDAIDAALPGAGLSRGALHEIAGASNDGASAGFATALLARCAVDGPVLWIARGPDVSAAGLAGLGMEASRLLIVNAPKRADALWAFEEALRTPAVAAAVAEIDDVDLTQSRRLQLAAETGGSTALLLRPPGEFARPSAARTRWHVAALPSAADDGGRSRRWRVNLARAQGGMANEWCIEHRDDGWALADGTQPAVSRDLPAAPADRPVRAAG